MRFGSAAGIFLALCISLSVVEVRAADMNTVPDNLSVAALEQLRQHHVLVTSVTYHQIFEPYLKSDLPVFITSDSLIRAFQVQLDDALFRFEQLNAARITEVVRLLWYSIAPRKETAKTADPTAGSDSRTDPTDTSGRDDVSELKDAALLKAQFVLAVALRLLGDMETRLPEALVTLVDQEVLNIVRATGTTTPSWPESNDGDLPRIDYTVFRPFGFYSRSEALQRYYRAIQWFQTFPFSIDRDDDLLAILLLGKSLSTTSAANRATRLRVEKFFTCHRELTGDGSGFDILLAAQIRRDRPSDLDSVRSYIYKPSADRETSATSAKDFFVIAPPVTADRLLFQKTISLEGLDRRKPTGLEVCAAIGSVYARRQLTDDLPEHYGELLISAIDNAEGLLDRPGLFNSYLKTLAALVDPAEPDAPAFMRNDAWQAKSCNAVLAGWVQFKHRFGLNVQAADYALGEALEGVPPGFVEPEPEFFGRLGDLAEQLNDKLERCGVFAPVRYRIADDLRRYAGLVNAKRYLPEADRFSDLNEEEIVVVNRSEMILEVVGNLIFTPEDYRQNPGGVADQILEFAGRMERGRYDDDPTYQALIIESGLDTKHHWKALLQMCRWLEILAHKQLRGVPFNTRDIYFLTEFGERLAGAMFYGEDNYLRPRDNTPAAVRLYKSPESKTILHAGIGRPREILVLYPFGGKDILCRGAILPYFEFLGVNEISDPEWKRRLDSDERPAVPRWFEPAVFDETLPPDAN